MSFWNACSTGGRQGLMEAYRLPGGLRRDLGDAPANPYDQPHDPEHVGELGNQAQAGAALSPGPWHGQIRR